MEEKVAVILFHKNILKIYKPEWILTCLESIDQQTYKNYSIFEVNYGDEGENDKLSLLDMCKNLYFKNQEKKYYSKNFKNHIFAMNYLINIVFNDLGYDYVMNINLDDYYHIERFEKQITFLKNNPEYSLVSSNFYRINENDKITQKMLMSFDKDDMEGEQKHIGNNFSRGNNVIAHPCVCMTKKFWDEVGPYKNKVGTEDFLLWKKAHKLGVKMHILREYLLYYRIHNTQITSANRK